jgi:hypothetical protein
MHIRQIVDAALTAEGLHPMDQALADAAVKRMRFVLLLHKHRGSSDWRDCSRCDVRVRRRGPLGRPEVH